MYRPAQDGIDKQAHAVRYTQAQPPEALAGLVHCFWELKTIAELSEDFHYHALPDACVNILLNQMDPRIAGITALRTAPAVLNLGKSFHYLGIELFPGVWQGNPGEVVDSYVGTPYSGALPLVSVSQKAAGLAFADKYPILASLVEWCLAEQLVVANPVSQKILSAIDRIGSVADMAAMVHLSPRQLQRRLKETTGFSPHDLLKVLRMQQSFKQHYLELYADQSHFIHSFRKLTGYTPGQYEQKFEA